MLDKSLDRPEKTIEEIVLGLFLAGMFCLGFFQCGFIEDRENNTENMICVLAYENRSSWTDLNTNSPSDEGLLVLH